jgi:serine protease Do
MINFKALALTATLAAGSIFAGVAPANASTCWFQRGDTGRLAPTYCQTDRRINANGHVVFDIVDHQGTEFTLVLWDDNTAEMIGLGYGVTNARTWTDAQGDLRIETAAGEMAIRF